MVEIIRIDGNDIGFDPFVGRELISSTKTHEASQSLP